jgi:glycosyltransferase involved in cell wall biosynthesis
MISISFIIHNFNTFEKPNVGGSSKNPIKIIKSLEPYTHINAIVYFNGSHFNDGIRNQFFFRVGFVKLFFKTILQNLIIIRRIFDCLRFSNILQIHHPHYGFSSIIIRNLFFRKKIIITKAHGTAVPELVANNYVGLKGLILKFNSKIHFKIDQFVLRNSDHVICSSKFQLAEMQSIYGVKRDRLTSIYNGFDKDFIVDSLKSVPLQFVFCGRIVPKKNIIYAIDLFNIVRLSGIECNLKLILGSSNHIEDQDTYNLILDKIGDCPYIEILFDLSESDLYREFSSSTVGLITSIGYESIPTVLFEMLGCGVKVFSTYDWGIPEILNQDSALTLDLFADREIILKYISNHDNQDNIKRLDLERYEIKSLAKEYLSLYNKIIV